MTDSDILLRGGLIISVSILIGIAGGYLGQSMLSASDGLFEETASDLGEAISVLLRSDTGSCMTVSFGVEPGSEVSFIELPGRIGGEVYRITVLPGLVYMELDGRRITVMEDTGILPMSPPLNERTISGDLAKEVCGNCGYTIETPCILKFEKRQNTDGVCLFVHTSPDPDPELPVKMKDLMELDQMVFVPCPDHWGKVEICTGDSIMIHHSGLILWKSGSNVLEEGFCLHPFITPSGMRMPVLHEETTSRFTVIREAILEGDLTYTDTWTVYV